MTRICPKCRYARTPQDDAPEWQCPSCHVAYAKVASAPPPPGYELPVREATRGTSFGSMLKWGLFLTVAGFAAWHSDWLLSQVKQRTASAETLVASQPAVTLYSAEWCGYCTATRNFFVANDIAFVEHDVEKTTAGYEGHKALGGGGVPVIRIGDDVLRGYNEGALRDNLKPWLASK